jgi:hypothetical protein
MVLVEKKKKEEINIREWEVWEILNISKEMDKWIMGLWKREGILMMDKEK